MKTKLNILLIAGLFLVASCTDLSEKLYDKLDSGEYGKTDEEIESIVGRAYASLRGGSSDGINYYPCSEFVFFLSAVSSDECLIPVRTGGDWYDDGAYVELHQHTWTADNSKIWALWKYCYSGIASVNSIIYQVEQSNMEKELRTPLLAELKGVRAYYYYKLLDGYGNVPVDTSYVVTEAPDTSPRAEVYEFVEKELLDNRAYLPDNAYGRFTKDAANVLLARLYLNSEVYINKARWEDCLTVCNEISGELEFDYFASFKTENQYSKEIIFSIPYDSKMGTVGNYLASMTYHYDQKDAFSATGNYQWCANGIYAQPGLYSAFDDNDIRRNSLLAGPQVNLKTGEVILIDGSIPLNYTEDVSNFNREPYTPQNEGIRLSKYEDKEGDSWERDYDMVLMRYAEVLMMQAECYVRLNQPKNARPFVQQIHERVSLDTPAVIDLDFIDQELRREFVFEDHRRTDNIRFGTFFNPWWEKGTDPADKRTALFPIPQKEIEKNSKLEQNPGYR